MSYVPLEIYKRKWYAIFSQHCLSVPSATLCFLSLVLLLDCCKAPLYVTASLYPRGKYSPAVLQPTLTVDVHLYETS